MKPVRPRFDPGVPTDPSLTAEAEGVRPRTRVTFEGTVFSWFAALFALSALSLQENLVLLMGCAAFAGAQASRFLARRNLAGLRVWREAPHRARAGVEVPVTYGVGNARRRPAAGVEVLDRLGPRARPVSLSLVVGGVEGHASVRHTSRILFLRRGLHRLGSLAVSSRFPLGFFRASAVSAQADSVLVRPPEGRATTRLRRWLGGAAQAHRRPSLVQRGDDVLHGVREFRDGDDPHRIHWRTSARRGALTITQWRREHGRSAVLILGRGHGAGHRAGRDFERAVSAIATLWRAAHREGLEVSLELGGGRSPLHRSETRQRGRGLDALATVRPQGARKPRAALRRLASKGGARIVVYVAVGEERGIRRRLVQAAGRDGDWLCLRADQPELQQWVGGLA